MKYKQLYEDTKSKLNSAEWYLNQAEGKLKKAENELEIIMTILKNIEGKESDIRKENDWLKTTIRLIVVDSDKIAGLAKELERNEMSLSYKI